jgi:hypothetical protein
MIFSLKLKTARGLKRALGQGMNGAQVRAGSGARFDN